ncbi:hypothetical protein QDX25_05965 [Auritidibacter ignavus]|uniref:hypothetical protein n=1 Tax=Auritidibacter ignavus TaxID=678932 RepID=UPI00244CF981|nr:hypothetical protein [Auritidibacter ignavus]WGH82687.1 hypothetical protein QDX25_05965 [Auritidibacter ignavus]
MTDPIQTFSLAERPDLLPAFLNLDIPWPAFIEPTRLLVEWGIHAHAEHQFIMLDGDTPIARASSLPLHWDGDPESLPRRGWDGVVEQSATDTYNSAELNTLCALEAGIDTGHTGRGLSQPVFTALRDHARAAGFEYLIAPVRPSGKTEFPEMPIEDYVERRRNDGQRADNWLRIHERIGGRIIALSHTSMTISAPLETWRAWTTEPFTTTGLTTVDGGIAPVYANADLDYAVYIEPNVWVRHRLTDMPAEEGQGS